MMPQKIKTLFIGPFSPPNSGDGVKNDYLRDGFEAENINNIIWFDTIKRSGSKFNHYFKLIKLMVSSRQLILSLNKYGRYTIIPIFFLFSLFSRKRAVLYVIGGTFDQQLYFLSPLMRKIFVRTVNRLDGVFAESKALMDGLQNAGIRNVTMIYNPRKDTGTRWELTDDNRAKAVFISRVYEDKGLNVFMDAVEKINAKGTHLELDIYGPVDSEYEAYLNQRVAESGGTITYKGVLKPDEVQNILPQYHFLGLPTFHFGEGLPGILVESGMAGMPIIITRFNALPEYFTHNESALFIEPRDVLSLENEILRLLNDDELASTLSKGILKTVEPFKVENVIKQSLEYMETRGWIFN